MQRFLLIFLCVHGFPAFAEDRSCFDIHPNQEPAAAIEACGAYLEDRTGPQEDIAEAHANRGIALREEGRLEESTEDLIMAVELDRATHHLRMLAWNFRELGRLTEAEAMYTGVLEQDDHWQGWLSRCVVRQDLELYQPAAADCEAALERDPENTDAMFFGARAHNFVGNGARALELSKLGQAREPDAVRHAVEEVWAIYNLRGKDEARRLAQSKLEQFPGDSGLLHAIESFR